MMGDHIVGLSRTWIGTQFHHQASAKGIGCDCLGLIRGIWADIGQAPIDQPFEYPYSWAFGCENIDLVAGVSRYLIPIPLADAGHGDVVACQMRLGGPVQHLGIFAQDGGEKTFIHAHSRFGVQETPYQPLWARLARAAFRFPTTNVRGQ